MYKSLYLPLFLGIIFLGSCRSPMPDPPIAGDFSYNSNDSALMQYIRAENDYTSQFMARVSGLHQTLLNELGNRTGNSDPGKEQIEDTTSCQSPSGIYHFFVKDSRTVYLHENGKTNGDDRVIYSETRPGSSVTVRISASKKFLFICTTGQGMTETRFLPSETKIITPRLIEAGEKDRFYQVEHFGLDYFWIFSNYKAPNGKLVQAKIAHPGSAFWIPVVNYPDSTRLTGFSVINTNILILLEKRSLKASLRIVDLANIQDPTKGNRIGFNDPEGELKFSGYEPESGKIKFRFSSVVTPETMYTYDLNNNKLGIRWQSKIRGADKDNYGARILWVTRNDGTKTPLTILYHKDLDKRDGTNPLVLTSDGGFDSPGKSRFNASWISLLDRGFYIAMSHPADNNFTESVTFLINQKYTSKGLITAIGRGSGVNQATVSVGSQPGTFKALILDGFTNDSQPLFDNTTKSFPPIFLIACGNNEKGADFGIVKMAVQIRKSRVDKNLLLLKPGCEDSSADQLAFLLSLYNIDK